MKFDYIKGRQVLDSRGNPTVEVEVGYSGYHARAISPSGASTGKYEAFELRDCDKTKYLGKSVYNAVNNVNNIIAENLKDLDFSDQNLIDSRLIELDGSENKKVLGANAILATSLAIAKLSSMIQNVPFFQYINNLFGLKDIVPSMPTPFVNILNGGVHADNKIDIQEFMIAPIKNVEFSEKIRICVEVFHNLKFLLKRDGFSTNVGDEGGFAPNLANADEAIGYIIRAIELAGYKQNQDVAIALDVAASSFENENCGYNIDGRLISSEEMVEYLVSLSKKYDIISIEDGMGEEDYSGWLNLTKKLAKNVQLVGDDLFVTNKKLLEMGVKDGYANSILIKPNQIGTLTETLDTIRFAHENNYKYMISHRSGETEDVTISHIAVGTGSGQIKTGSVCRGERTAKYNELLRIAELIEK